MSFKANWDGKSAYRLHVTANRLYDAKQYGEAQAKFDQALSLYESAVKAGCAQPRILMAYGVLLLKQRKFDEAHDIMLKTEKLPGMTADDKRQLRLNFAVCQWKLGKLDSAIELMKRVAEDGKNSMIYGSLGYMLIEKARQTGDFDEAIAFNQEAYEYDEDDAITLDNLGQLALSMGDREKARAHFLRAIEKKPAQVDTLYYLAILDSEDGRKDEARAYLKRALDCPYSALCTTSRAEAEALLAKIGG